MKTFVHLMYIPFTGLGLYEGYRGDKWLRNRIRVFKQYTLPSLLNQTNRNYVVWISWRSQERNNPIVKDLERYLRSFKDLPFVFTYHGVCFWDDKHSNDNLEERLALTLPVLRSVLEKSDYILLTIQPSDDMYLSHAVDDIQAAFSYINDKAFGYIHGYIMNYATKEIAEYNPATLPPFFTLKFPSAIFYDPKKHWEYAKYKSHEEVVNLGITTSEERSFVVGTHGENISTTYQHPYRGRLLPKDKKESILVKTGTLYSDPVVVRQGLRLILRRILNLLPFEAHIRTFYHNYLPNVL